MLEVMPGLQAVAWSGAARCDAALRSPGPSSGRASPPEPVSPSSSNQSLSSGSYGSIEGASAGAQVRGAPRCRPSQQLRFASAPLARLPASPSTCPRLPALQVHTAPHPSESRAGQGSGAGTPHGGPRCPRRPCRRRCCRTRTAARSRLLAAHSPPFPRHLRALDAPPLDRGRGQRRVLAVRARDQPARGALPLHQAEPRVGAAGGRRARMRALAPSLQPSPAQPSRRAPGSTRALTEPEPCHARMPLQLRLCALCQPRRGGGGGGGARRAAGAGPPAASEAGGP